MANYHHYYGRMPPPADPLWAHHQLANSAGGLIRRKGIPAPGGAAPGTSPAERQHGRRSYTTMVLPRGPGKGSQHKEPQQPPRGGTEAGSGQWAGKGSNQSLLLLHRGGQAQQQQQQQQQRGQGQQVPHFPPVAQEVIASKGESAKKLFKGSQKSHEGRGSQEHAQAHTRAEGGKPSLQERGAAEEEYKRRLEVYQQNPAAYEEMEGGHFVVTPGQRIDRTPPFSKGRYKVVQLLGAGTYGKVVLAEDDKYQQALVAVKLVRNHPPIYKQAAKNEIQILQQLNGYGNCVKLLRTFTHDGHVSMTFELLGESIFSLVQRQQFSLQRVRDVTVQILQAIEYVHANHIIHSDIKSENVLIASHPDYPGPLYVKVVDFGCAVYSRAWHPPVAGTMNYRSPEAVLQAEWSYPVDLWGVGCIFVEMLIGRQMFELAHDDVHLHMMTRCFGPIPPNILLRGWTSASQRGLLALGWGGQVQIAPCRPEGRAQIETVKPLAEWVTHPQALDLARCFFEYDPARRITANKALQHDFFAMQLPEEEFPPQPAPALLAAQRAQTTDEAHAHKAQQQKQQKQKQQQQQQKKQKQQLQLFIAIGLILLVFAWYGPNIISLSRAYYGKGGLKQAGAPLGKGGHKTVQGGQQRGVPPSGGRVQAAGAGWEYARSVEGGKGGQGREKEPTIDQIANEFYKKVNRERKEKEEREAAARMEAEGGAGGARGATAQGGGAGGGGGQVPAGAQ